MHDSLVLKSILETKKTMPKQSGHRLAENTFSYSGKVLPNGKNSNLSGTLIASKATPSLQCGQTALIFKNIFLSRFGSLTLNSSIMTAFILGDYITIKA